MRNFNDVETVYVKKLKTVSLKLNLEYIADPEGGRPKVESPDEVYELLKAIYRQLDDDQEHLVLLVLNIANEVTGFKVISSGAQSAGPADGKLIFRNALMLGAARIILAHNHPSGSMKPSAEDIAFTQRMIDAGKAIDIPLVDHIIVTHKGYVSMRAEGHCKFERV